MNEAVIRKAGRTTDTAPIAGLDDMWNADNGDGTYSNPVLYTDYSDPDAIRAGRDYYLVASSFCSTPGLPILHSVDLVNWKLVNYVLPKIPGSRYDQPMHGCGVWAPSIREHGGLFYVCFPMPDEGIFMSTAADPCGRWSPPARIWAGKGRIDPCPFWDTDGRAYLVSGVAKSRTGYKSVLHLQEMRPDGMGLIGEPEPVFDGNGNGQHTIEGPKLYRRNGWYYIFAPAGGVRNGWQTVLRSRNIRGPYEYRVVLRQGNSPVNGPHQGAWVDTAAGEDWFIHFQDAGPAGRIVHLQPMRWEDDWPVIGAAPGGETCGEPVRRCRKPDTGAGSAAPTEPPPSNDFRGIVPGLRWQWNANSRPEWFDCEKGGFLLRAVHKEGVYGDCPNLLLLKWPAPEFSCITEMDLSGLQPGDEAGVISLGMRYGAVSFLREEKALKVIRILGRQVFGKITAEATEEDRVETEVLPAGAGRVWIQYTAEREAGQAEAPEGEETEPTRVRILYGTEKNHLRQILEMSAVPGRWVGVRNGVFCVSAGDRSTGFVRIESVAYRRISR